MKICLTCAEGGHFNELLNIIDAFNGHDIFFVIIEAETTKFLKEFCKVYYIRDGPKPRKLLGINIHLILIAIYYVYLILPCLRILIKEKPKTIVSTGGQATLTLSYLGKLLGMKIIYIESLARINDLSGTGKIIYPIADLFLVQWETLCNRYKKSKYWGRVI